MFAIITCFWVLAIHKHRIFSSWKTKKWSSKIYKSRDILALAPIQCLSKEQDSWNTLFLVKCWSVVMDSFDTSGTLFPFWHSFYKTLSHKTTTNVVKNVQSFFNTLPWSKIIYTVDSGISKRLNSKQSLISKHFWWNWAIVL